MRIIARDTKASEMLQESESRFRLLAEKMRDVIWQATPDMVFTYVSPSCEQMIGYTPEELTGS